MNTTEQKLDRAATTMVLTYPWWANLYLNLKRVRDDEIPTMATDGTSLLYNAAFVDSLSPTDLVTILLHEVGHCALLHPFRRMARDPLLWNIACDLAVNTLLDADGIKIPPYALQPHKKYLNKTTEEIYADLLKKCTQTLAPKWLDLKDAGAPGQKDGTTEKQWKDILAENRGLQPGALARSLELAAEAPLDWRDLLSQFVWRATSSVKERTWIKQSRRVPLLPGAKRLPEINLAVCVDTSGSIDAGLLATFLKEIKGITDIAGAHITIISGDAAVSDIIAPGDPLPATLQGGGGTDFRPLIAAAVECDACAIVYFTDGDGTFPNAAPNTDVLWAGPQVFRPPFGEFIKI